MSDKQDGPFSLTNCDSGAHNILVNNDFEITSVTDFDGVVAAPIEMVVRFPVLTGLDRGAPGHVETRLLAIARIEQRGRSRDPHRKKAACQFCRSYDDTASTLQDLLAYKGQQGFTNDMWMSAYSRLLRTHVKS